MRNKKNIKTLTTEDLFFKIHSQASQKDLERYKKNILFLIKKSYIENKDILEIGCGGRASGIYTFENYKPKSITAIDISKDNVINSRRMCTDLGLKATIKQGDAMDLQFKDNFFDFVFSNGVIHHTSDPYKCFKEMARVLKPNGFCFLGIYGYGNIWGKVIHPLGMFLGKIIPFKLMERLVNFTGIMKSQENSILDWFYTPIQKSYRFSELSKWFKGFDKVIRLKSPKWFYNIPLLTRLFFRDGYIYIIARKIK